MDLKLQIFKFKNQLNEEQLDVARVAYAHLEHYDNFSEKEITNSLNESLKPFTYYPEVKSFLESVNTEIDSNSLAYTLKDLYRKVERQNLSNIYRQPLVTLLEIINRPDDDSRMEAILNELSMYNWIPEIKRFLLEVTSNPIQRQNLKNSGKGELVYTLVEKVEEGHLAFISDSWFLISEKEIKKVLLEDYIKDMNKLREMRILEQVLTLGSIVGEKIIFDIDENIQLGISTKRKNEIYINNEKLNVETTLETIFQSTIIPALKRDYYVIAETANNNTDKFVEMDIAIKVNNILTPHLENFVFNYKDKIYMYSKDRRYGTRFYVYENASDIIHDVQNELDYDLSKFFENKLSKEIKNLRSLEDKEQVVQMKLKDVLESIQLLKDCDILAESKELQDTLDKAIMEQAMLYRKLEAIKAEKSVSRKELLK